LTGSFNLDWSDLFDPTDLFQSGGGEAAATQGEMPFIITQAQRVRLCELGFSKMRSRISLRSKLVASARKDDPRGSLSDHVDVNAAGFSGSSFRSL
jgi:hypothetical protein